MKNIVLIPAYQPDVKLEKLIHQLKEENFDIIVVNDGSSVESKRIFESISKDCIVLTHEVNRGKGCALKTGFSYIKNMIPEDYVVVTMDCDGQHQIEDAKKLFAYNQDHLEELVLGSRGFDKDVPLRSQLGNTITRGVFALATGTRVFDTQTGLRSFSNHLIDRMIEIPGERYEYEIQMLLRCAGEGITIHEIPIETIYIDNNSSSHFHPIKDSFKIYKEICKYSASSIFCFFLNIILYCLLLLGVSYLVSNILSGIICCLLYYFWKKSHSILKSLGKIVLSTVLLFGFHFLIPGVIVSKILTEICLIIGMIFFKGSKT